MNSPSLLEPHLLSPLLRFYSSMEDDISKMVKLLTIISLHF